ncbi:MAG: LysE family transporter [Pseudomonadota bacterium]
MIDWAGTASIFVAFFIVAVSPGPATLAVSAVSAASGRKAGMTFGFGLAVGLAFWGLVAATGLGAVLQASTGLLVALKVAGGLYLLWLAYGSARSAMRAQTEKPRLTDRPAPLKRRLFTKGLVLNLSNPKAVVAWMAALSVGLGTDGHLVTLVLATAGCAVIGLLIYIAYAAAFSLSMVMDGYERFRRRIDGIVAALFAVAGLSLIRSVLTRN